MKLEVGKKYLTRAGKVVVLHDNGHDVIYPYYHDNGYGEDGFHGVTEDGKSCIQDDYCDIVSEYTVSSPDRDAIAQQAMVAIISKYKKENTPEWSEAVAKSAYMYADAMIKVAQ